MFTNNRILVKSLVIATLLSVGFNFNATLAEEDENDGPWFNFEVVNFAAELPELSRADVYVKINYAQLQFIKAGEQFRSEYEVIVAALRDDKKESEKSQSKELFVDESEEGAYSLQFALEQMSLELTPGEYTIAVTVRDKETQKQRRLEKEIELADYSSGELTISGLLYSSGFEKRGESTLLVPRVSDEQVLSSKLYAYFEVYHLNMSDSFQVSFEVLDSNGDSYNAQSYRTKGNEGLGKQFIPLVQENKLPHGQYRVVVTIEQGDKKTTSESQFNWFLAGLPRSFTSIDQAIEVLRYIASKPELDKMKKAPKAEKHAELIAFWKSKDPDPETPENEKQYEYYSRVVYANNTFGTNQREGWKTDMGRVFILLGPADQIERQPFNQTYLQSALGRIVKAVQVWSYYEYNRDLVFVDENGFGEYRLENEASLYEIIR
jgi:GWxTD domain-containing protein